MEFITAVFEALSTGATSASNLIVNIFNTVVAIFWSGTALTTFGQLLLIPASVTFVLWGINWIIKLVKSIRASR